MILLTGLALALMYSDDIAAEKPDGMQYSQFKTFVQVVDSTAAVQYDSVDVDSGMGRFTGIPNYSSLDGYFVLEYTDVDTGTGGVYCDTTKDTVVVQFITYAQGGTPNKVVYTDTVTAIHVTASVVNTDYQTFDLSDSTLFDYIVPRVIAILQDSVYTKARLAAAIDYKFTWKFYAK